MIVSLAPFSVYGVNDLYRMRNERAQWGACGAPNERIHRAGGGRHRRIDTPKGNVSIYGGESHFRERRGGQTESNNHADHNDLGTGLLS